MKCINIAVIGIGNMGSAHANCIAGGEISGLTLTAVCDINANKVKVFKESHPDVLAFTDYKELIKSKSADAVVIATPHPLHAEIAEFALNNGLHVLAEKPVDIAASKASRLNAIAQKSQKVFAIMFNQRTNPLFQKARELVKTGLLGELKRTVWIVTNWYRTESYYKSGSWRATWKGEGGGVLLNQAPHNLDLWQWICGMPRSVTAFCDIAKYHSIEVEDDVTIFTKYENGATGTFITTTGEFPGTNRLEIAGTLGKIVLEDGILKWWKLKENEADVRQNSPNGFTAIDYCYSEIKPTQKETAHKGILQNFANAVLQGEELLSPGIEGINELLISNAAYLSSFNSNKEVTLPFETEDFDKLLQTLIEKSQEHKNINTEKMNGNYNPRWNVNW